MQHVTGTGFAAPEALCVRRRRRVLEEQSTFGHAVACAWFSHETKGHINRKRTSTYLRGGLTPVPAVRTVLVTDFGRSVLLDC